MNAALSDRLSKSRYMEGLRCPLAVYLSVHNYELKGDASPGQQARFDAGNRIGELARDRYPGGVLIEEDHFHHREAIACHQGGSGLGRSRHLRGGLQARQRQDPGRRAAQARGRRLRAHRSEVDRWLPRREAPARRRSAALRPPRQSHRRQTCLDHAPQQRLRVARRGLRSAAALGRPPTSPLRPSSTSTACRVTSQR